MYLIHHFAGTGCYSYESANGNHHRMKQCIQSTLPIRTIDRR